MSQWLDNTKFGIQTKYENSIPMPRKIDFYFTLKATAPSGKVHEIRVFEEELYRKAMADYAVEVVNRQNAFRQDLLEELGITNHPKADLLFRKAWELGHSYSYNTVVDWAFDLVDFLRD
jgi:hypothetical protein